MSDLTEEVSDALRHLDVRHAAQPYADNQRWNAARVIRLQQARITELEAEIDSMVLLASPSGRQPGDTHVKTYMPVDLYDARSHIRRSTNHE